MRDNNCPRAKDQRSTQNLVALAMSADDDHDQWDLVVTLHYRGGAEEFQVAADLCRSQDSRERKLGADILGQLGWADRTFLAESVDLLIPLLNDPNDSVVSSAAVALGHRGDPRAILPLCALNRRPDSELRQSSAFALSSFDEPAAISAKIQLSADEDPRVRDWATFGLGSLSNVDSEEIREALYARSEDEDEVVRGEALVGLARRQDERALGLVRRELTNKIGADLILEAAELLADPTLVHLLRAQRDDWDAEDEERLGHRLDDAIAACRSQVKTNTCSTEASLE
jgi:HEAT repeat protein